MKPAFRSRANSFRQGAETLAWQGVLHANHGNPARGIGGAKTHHRPCLDLRAAPAGAQGVDDFAGDVILAIAVRDNQKARGHAMLLPRSRAWGIDIGRSEEHTSELQSQSNLVCRLL